MKTLNPILLVTALTFCSGAVPLFGSEGRQFSSPEEAVAALGTAANALDRPALRNLFGLDTDELVATDQVQMTNELVEFSAAFNQTNWLVRPTESRCILYVGKANWPFPIPIIKDDGQWSFDTSTGKQELLNRRIGRNELSTLQAVRAYVDAQREYASRDRDDSGVLKYAQKIASSPGKKDGLYWPPDLDGELSPLGPFVANAQAEGYSIKNKSDEAERQPFHGYYFKLLKAQGRHAAGGKYSYVINGNMIGGFALVAWPADYGESGIMTFLVNQQGRVYQKDLGSNTAKHASGIKRYDPDDTWKLSPD